MWRAWALDPPTIAFVAWVAWFAIWEAWALNSHDYYGTWTAHIRPLFLSAPITWWLFAGLYVWFGIHILAPSFETWLAGIVRQGLL